jgi:hypothetical protein
VSRPDEFPAMVVVGVDNQASPRFSAVRELTPMFQRPPDRVWAQCFRIECENASVIDWQGADFAKCGNDDVALVCDAMRDATAAADARFVAHLRTVEPEKASDIVAAEQISAVSTAVDGPHLLPTGPPNRVY